MRASHKLRSSAREPRTITPAAAANEVRAIRAGLADIAVKFNEIALGVTDSRRARKLSALALCVERAACPLGLVATDLERAVRP